MPLAFTLEDRLGFFFFLKKKKMTRNRFRVNPICSV